MLIAEHLEKNYRKRRVVKDASYQVDAAQVVGLLGPALIIFWVLTTSRILG